MVPDASVLVFSLIDDGPVGRWADAQLDAGPLAAPHSALVEASNLLRRALDRGRIDATTGALAHRDLTDLAIDLYPFRPFADRIWQLRDNVTAYDAWYVAVAELVEAPLATLDRRLARAAGPRCELLLPTDQPGG